MVKKGCPEAFAPVPMTAGTRATAVSTIAPCAEVSSPHTHLVPRQPALLLSGGGVLQRGHFLHYESYLGINYVG